MTSGAALVEDRTGPRDGFAVEAVPEPLGSREDALWTGQRAREIGAAVVAVDGYSFGAGYQRALCDAGFPVLFLDDYGHGEEYCAAWVLNQNPYAEEGMYPRRSGATRLLLGPRYALLRREFAPWADWNREIPPLARRALISAGGGDPVGLSALATEALTTLQDPPLQVRQLVGQLADAPGTPASERLEVVRNARDMPALMAWADFSVAHAGTTSLEQCCLGLPSLLVAAVDNQRRLAASLAGRGAARDLGPPEVLTRGGIAAAAAVLARDPEQRRTMSERGRALVDGQGAPRVVAELLGLPLRLRPARPADRRLLWEWRNDPVTRAMSFHRDPVPWEEHCRWFDGRIRDPATLLLLAVDAQDQPVGQARFDLDGATAVISVAVAPGHRGRGLGRVLIDLACRRVFATTGAAVVLAFIRADNTASLAAFATAGFHDETGSGEEDRRRWVRRRDDR
jgi:spore coat polysaccharide biosynthesis predicted glycosyltransferase SpsG/L-amino acid N-acyltransferase YncA